MYVCVHILYAASFIETLMVPAFETIFRDCDIFSYTAMSPL